MQADPQSVVPAAHAGIEASCRGASGCTAVPPLGMPAGGVAAPCPPTPARGSLPESGCSTGAPVPPTEVLSALPDGVAAGGCVPGIPASPGELSGTAASVS